MSPDGSYGGGGCPTPGKNRYSTKRIAKRALGGGQRKHFGVYLCRCGAWHHTHRTPRARQW